MFHKGFHFPTHLLGDIEMKWGKTIVRVVRVGTIIIIALVIVLVGLLPKYQPKVEVASAATYSCSTSNSAAKYTVKLCFTSPATNNVLSGDSEVGVKVSVTGSNAAVQRMVFYLNGEYLLTDYKIPYSFNLPTTRWADGSYTISVEAQMKGGFTTSRATETVRFKNNTAAAAMQVSDKAFTPTSGRDSSGAPFVVMAAGDGASGEGNETRVTDLIAKNNPNLLLYLGDVYERGAPTEFYNWYGPAGSNYDRFRAITDPTVGNHEYLYDSKASGYFQYWDNIPNYYSFDAGGWHFISLNSNSNRTPTNDKSPQYAWLKQDLEQHAGACTIVFYHHPVYNIGPEGPRPDLSNIWQLMVQNHVTLVLNGHDHDYQRWYPLDGSGNRSDSGITEFVVGTGGHGVQKVTGTDARVAFANAKSPDALGALKLTLSPDSASFSYLSITGSTLDSGSVPCQK